MLVGQGELNDHGVIAVGRETFEHHDSAQLSVNIPRRGW
jgi:hypothetical protein